MIELTRMWINQPSTHSPLHHLHGTNVLGYKEEGHEKIYRVYFLSGDVISMRIVNPNLSFGWISKSGPM